MEFREILLDRSFVTRYLDTPVDPGRLSRVLEAAGNVTGFAQQYPYRFLVIDDMETRQILQRACTRQRQRWLENSVDWMPVVLAETGETQRLDGLREAPCVIVVFGEVDKPAWREASWGAVERLRVAALNEGLRAEPVTVSSLEFLNGLLDVPQSFNAVALLTLGEAAQTQEPAESAPTPEQQRLPYEADPERLRSWDDPVRLGQLSRHGDEPPHSMLTDKQLLLHAIRAAAAVQSCDDINDVFDQVMQELEHFFRVERGSVSFLNPQDNTLRLRNILKTDGPPVGENRPIPLDESNVIGWVVLNGSGVHRNEIASEDVFDEQMCSEELRSDMIVPILHGTRVFGTLNCGSRKPNAFRSMDFALLRELGRLVGGALDRLLGPARSAPRPDADAAPTPEVADAG